MRTAILWCALLACNRDKHALPVVVIPDAPPAPVSPVEPPTGMLDLFGPSQPRDLEAEIAKLEAQKATLPAPQRPLIDRMVANMRAQDAAMRERDPIKARPLQVAANRDLIALLEAMAAADPDNLETQLQVGSSLQLLVSTVDSLEITDEIQPADILKRARALADRTVAKHPEAAKAWALKGSLTSYRDPVARMRAYERCVKLDAGNQHCTGSLAELREDYVRPYCDAAEVRPGLAFHAASRKPSAGATPVEYHHETWYLAATPRFTSADLSGISAETNTTVHHQADGTTRTEQIPGLRLHLTDAKLEEMVAWSRDQVKRDEATALMVHGTLAYIDERSMFHDSEPGVSRVGLAEVCTATKTRKLGNL